MGGLLGHVALGSVFLSLGSWHLFNHTKLHFTHRRHYNTPLPWFPTPFSRHFELLFVIFGCTTFSLTEVIRWPILSPDGSIPSNRLRHLEHASMAMSFCLYATFALLLDKQTKPQNQHSGVVWSLVSLAFAQELLLFHFHSTDHVGVERQYHLLLELVVVVCLATTIMGIRFSRSFIVGFVRSLAVTLQGLWLVVMGIMLWTPALVPKGCSIRREDGTGREVIGCDSDEFVDRGKALVNILFSWLLIGVSGLVVLFYLGLEKVYGAGGSTILHEQEEEEVSSMLNKV